MAHELSAYHSGSWVSVMSERAGIFWSIGDFSETLKVTRFLRRGRDMAVISVLSFSGRSWYRCRTLAWNLAR
jgi:hypothetical protein